MNTRHIAEEYRLTHWAGVMRERNESGLSVRAFCESAGFHQNIYYYWQRKLREATCDELGKMQGKATRLAPTGFAEVILTEQRATASAGNTHKNQICIEASGVRISAGSEYPAEKIADILRVCLSAGER